jgi:methionyl-tRNA formyltransferase
MVAKPDAGDIVEQKKIPIAFTDTAFDVFNNLTEAAVDVIRRAWPQLLDGTAPRLHMNLDQGSYFGGRKPADGTIDWTKSAVQIYNLIRGVTHPYPGAFTELDGNRVIIWQAWPVSGTAVPGRIIATDPLLVGTGDGLLEIRVLQMEGGSEEPASLFKDKISGTTETFT